ncbi:MAG: hypothetical protein PHW18_02030 [Sulfuricurvum sp.]|uniref:hypothetical protein n=1 Tax=Sulfuricurvum sp. TaxID=2025608 RepID=UPI00262CDD04|nr:hypothetical protein [Sulfuricurvum sp.]MDD2828334.1 hypothetical protein [Sulfuricurvum sp.]MDD4949711.1 hypothetical protein [Sulfuricurvum sp.]
MRQAIGLASSVLAAFVFIGCGGGGSSSTGGNSVAGTSVATFIDSPVSGLEFDTSYETNAVTDANGNFRYTEGESVAFHIGNLYLGSAVPKNGKVTPLDLIGTTDSTDPRVVRMLQTLQSLDNDQDSTNGITIDPAIVATLKIPARIDMKNATDSDVLGIIGKSVFDVNASVAQSNFKPNTASNASKGYSPTTPATAGTDIGNTGKYTLVAWNDLGMHCMDGKDYSVFSILPPYNNLHAHLIDKTLTAGKSITTGVTLTYEAVADTTGSINTYSAGKTNFWDWVLSLFGGRPADDHGLNMSGGAANPTPSLTPAGMTYNGANGWWEAEGIPVTPMDDKNISKNYYPMVKVVARDATGTIIATTKVVLPVSDEMSCVTCHASNSVAAAKPTAGWINNTASVEKDWKQNILRLHDQKHPTAISDAGMAGTYKNGSTLLANADAGQPVLCAKCHKSNALGTGLIAGIKPLTEALHSKHATVTDPTTGLSMDSSTNRDSCYKCHPGSVTKCLRGAMGNAKNANGSNAIDCQSCHGKMSDVGKSGREGWLDQPNCQQCHDRTAATANFTRFTSVFSSPGTLRATIDTKFATTANTPMAGKSLYRFSKGHGNLQCEACHGATHAEYPSSHANDNVQSIALQGHTGTIGECTTCHSTIPTTTNAGPHGLHPIGSTTWYKNHRSAAKAAGATQGLGTDACAACHGTDYRGTVLSKTAKARTVSGKTFAAGEMVTCYKCHNGPSGD